MADYDKVLSALRERVAQEVTWAKERVEREAAVVIAGLEAQADLAERYRGLRALDEGAAFYRAVPFTASERNKVPYSVMMNDNWPVVLEPRLLADEVKAIVPGDYYLVVLLVPRKKP